MFDRTDRYCCCPPGGKEGGSGGGGARQVPTCPVGLPQVTESKDKFSAIPTRVLDTKYSSLIAVTE